MRFCAILLPLVILITIPGCNPDDPKPAKNKSIQKSAPKVFPDSAFYQPRMLRDFPYQILYPRKYDSTSSYPLVIFLHGIDERGSDNQRQLKWGASLFQSDSVSRDYPAFVVFPQCPDSVKWYYPSMQERLKALIDHLVSTNAIDPKRIYLEGLSMGGTGTFEMVAVYPDLFAAAVAIAGAGDSTKASQMAKVNWKIYGGMKDTRNPGELSTEIANALRNAGANVSLKIYPDADHKDTWVKAFAEPDFISWVFEKTK